MNDELVLAVRRDIVDWLIPSEFTLYSEEVWANLMCNIVQMPRSEAEYNFDYKHLVSYLAIRYRDKLLVRQRKGEWETRLSNKFGCLGGHMNDTDITLTPTYAGANTACAAANREYHEECCGYTNYDAKMEVENWTPIGFINLNTDDVNKVHLGVVLETKIEYRLYGDGLHYIIPTITKSAPVYEQWALQVIQHYKEL